MDSSFPLDKLPKYCYRSGPQDSKSLVHIPLGQKQSQTMDTNILPGRENIGLPSINLLPKSLCREDMGMAQRYLRDNNGPLDTGHF